jgi:hypothetical protein
VGREESLREEKRREKRREGVYKFITESILWGYKTGQKLFAWITKSPIELDK